MTMLSPIPYRIPLTDRSGLIDRNWQQFFEALLARVGGVGDIAAISDIETLTTQEGSAANAQMHDFQAALDDLAAFASFEATPNVPAPEAEVMFEALSIAVGEVLRQRLDDLEVLTLFSW